MQSQDNLRIALLSAFAIGLHALERLIPSPVPWLRFGFANIIVLVALVIYGFRVGMMITLVRVLIGSLFIGSFLGPGFVLSLSGGIVSTTAMFISIRLFRAAISPFGLSIVGAFFHNLTQLLVAYVLFIRRLDAMLYLAPLILFLGIITGSINGLLALSVIKRLG
ncbi:MAG: Gx transporter family protein [Nitrospirae bacterium]|nr:MAG: Gx transporter family protein [Nitrospirota bacterium]